MKKIMVVEDDPVLGKLLTNKFSEEHQVTLFTNKLDALSAIRGGALFDLIVLDVGLPDGSGFEIAENIKLQNLKTPFIFLTAQADANSRLQGYEMGADEYIPKPFHLKELMIKVAHIFDQHKIKNELVLDDKVINFNELSLKRADGSIEYPAANDLRVLQFLIQSSPNVVSRDDILNFVWGADKNLNHRTVDNTIVRLKKLLGNDSECIRSVRSIGYQWMQKKENP